MEGGNIASDLPGWIRKLQGQSDWSDDQGIRRPRWLGVSLHTGERSGDEVCSRRAKFFRSSAGQIAGNIMPAGSSYT